MNNNDNNRTNVLIAEYKKMRDEIRSYWTQYYSLTFGLAMTGIASAFYLAYSSHGFIFLLLPMLIVAWLAAITIIRANIRHISNYISKVEAAINGDVMYYETRYAHNLWRSTMFIVLHILVIFPLGFVHFYSFLKAINYMSQECYHYLWVYSYWALFVTSTLIVIKLFLKVPKMVSTGVYDVNKF
jgi:hypothetical protein